VAGCCEYCDEPSDSGVTELVCTVKITVLWDVSVCILEETDRRFRDACCLS
jgi:hypothetical protein